jgi:hypothetical protein
MTIFSTCRVFCQAPSHLPSHPKCCREENCGHLTNIRRDPRGTQHRSALDDVPTVFQLVIAIHSPFVTKKGGCAYDVYAYSKCMYVYIYIIYLYTYIYIYTWYDIISIYMHCIYRIHRIFIYIYKSYYIILECIIIYYTLFYNITLIFVIVYYLILYDIYFNIYILLLLYM